MKITSAMYSVTLYSVSMLCAFGEAPCAGVKKARVAGSRWLKAAGILFRPGRDALDDV
jgi:hypothetical protein